MDVHYSSNTVEWSTPRSFMAKLEERFGRFDLDPCATPENAVAPTFYTKEDDGLSRPWKGLVFMNPPYGRGIGAWLRKAYDSANEGATVVCLVPARTDTAWWHDFAAKGRVEFIRGRLRFGNATANAPFPCALVIFQPGELA